MLATTLRSAQPTLLRSSAAPRAFAVPSLRLAPSAAHVARRTFASTPAAQKIATRFTAEHEWVKFDDESNTGTIGITDYAQKSLGDVVYVELPSEGSEVKQGGECVGRSSGPVHDGACSQLLSHTYQSKSAPSNPSRRLRTSTRPSRVRSRMSTTSSATSLVCSTSHPRKMVSSAAWAVRT